MRNQEIPTIHNPLRRIARVLSSLALIAAAPFAFIAGCQSKLLYYPRPYAAGVTDEWRTRTKGMAIDFSTSQGSQRAFLQGNLEQPRNLWIVCGGNATLALDWADWIEEHAPRQDAWLLVDFPGYGDCEGKPNPARIRESMRAAIPLAADAVGMSPSPDPSRLRFFGHSLGAAAVLIGASEFGMQRGVLLSPFTSTMEMSRRLTGVPLDFLVTHRYDNQARLAELAARGPGRVIILHGTRDEVIPFAMSEKLAAERKDSVRLVPLPDGRHNDIPYLHAEPLAAALDESGRPAAADPP